MRTYEIIARLGAVAMVLYAAGYPSHARAELAQANNRPGEPPPSRFAGAGTWRSVADSAATARGWRIHALQNRDGGVQAKLSVPGVAQLDGAAVEAQVIGREAFGVLLDEKGSQIATFNATLWGAGAGGSFIMGNGQGGTWGYDPTTKAEVVRLEERAAAVSTGAPDSPVADATR